MASCCNDTFFIGDFGLALTIKFKKRNNQPRDLSNATVLEMVFFKPDGTTDTRTAEFPEGETGVEGRLQYVLESNLLDTVGTWRFRGIVTEGTAAKYRSPKISFEVAE